MIPANRTICFKKNWWRKTEHRLENRKVTRKQLLSIGQYIIVCQSLDYTVTSVMNRVTKILKWIFRYWLHFLQSFLKPFLFSESFFWQGRYTSRVSVRLQRILVEVGEHKMRYETWLFNFVLLPNQSKQPLQYR